MRSSRKHLEGIVRTCCIVIAFLALSSLAGIAVAAHDPRPPMPDVVVFESATGDVHFPHTRHQRMRCSRCHHQIHAVELDTPHDKFLETSWIKCRICHEEESEFGSDYFKCSGCHHAEPESIVDETISAKVVIHESCWKCHKAGTGVEASKKCSYCHTEKEK